MKKRPTPERRRRICQTSKKIDNENNYPVPLSTRKEAMSKFKPVGAIQELLFEATKKVGWVELLIPFIPMLAEMLNVLSPHRKR